MKNSHMHAGGKTALVGRFPVDGSAKKSSQLGGKFSDGKKSRRRNLIKSRLMILLRNFSAAAVRGAQFTGQCPR